jgi:hypothetical protein
MHMTLYVTESTCHQNFARIYSNMLFCNIVAELVTLILLNTQSRTLTAVCADATFKCLILVLAVHS